MALDSQNREISPESATADFDKRVSVLYDKMYREVEKEAKKVFITYKLNLDAILSPADTDTSKRITRRYNAFRIKMMRNIEVMSRRLITTGSISLFNMYSENKTTNKKYEKQYNLIRATLLDRVQVAVSRMKHDTTLEGARISEFLFPIKNTALYSLQFELLKQKLLFKMWKGVNNLDFYASETVDGKKVSLTTNAEVPIDTFILPTTNSKYFAIHMEALKHYMLAKIWKGVKNIDFYASETVDGKKVPLTTQVDVPLASFLIPTRNSIPIAIQYEMVKHKLLKKVSKAINTLSFTDNEDMNIFDHFMPQGQISAERFSNTISKAVGKSIERKGKAQAGVITRQAKTNEFMAYKAQERMDRQIDLDIERNNILKDILYGGSAGARPMGSGAKPINTRYNSKSNTFGVGMAAALGNSLGPALTAGITKVALPALAVAAGAAIGWKIGTLINETQVMKDLNKAISTPTKAGVSSARWEIVQKMLSRESTEVKKEFGRIGGWDMSGGDAQVAISTAKKNIADRRTAVSSVKPTISSAELQSVNNSAAGILNASGGSLEAKMDALIMATRENKPKEINLTTTILGQRGNNNELFNGLDGGN